VWARRVSILAVPTAAAYRYCTSTTLSYSTVLVLVPTASHNLCFKSTGQLGVLLKASSPGLWLTASPLSDYLRVA
jgi:hypothetical protein